MSKTETANHSTSTVSKARLTHAPFREPRVRGSDPLPEFDRPPVSEVVLAVAFEPLPALQTPQLGVIWDRRFRADFPKTQQQPPYDPPVERFHMASEAPRISFQVGGMMPAPRLWLLDETESHLIQVQANWFARNWRRLRPEDEYPRYDQLCTEFEAHLTAFAEEVAAMGLGELHPTQCEVTYVNTIESGRTWQDHAEMFKVLSLLRAPEAGFLCAQEESRFAAQYIISEDDRQRGRLHVVAEPVFRLADRSPAITLNLTARGAPLSADVDGILEFLDLGREWIVRGFVDLTTEEAQSEWGRKA